LPQKLYSGANARTDAPLLGARSPVELNYRCYSIGCIMSLVARFLLILRFHRRLSPTNSPFSGIPIHTRRNPWL
jgi:hypothetical protein